MKRKRLSRPLATQLVALAALAGNALAQSAGGAYLLDPLVIAAGGGHSSGGTYVLEVTLGQDDAGATLSGGDYDVAGGFQEQSAAAGNLLFGNGFE